MTTSDQINEIAAALSKAQGQMRGATKDSANPFFKSKYADLASVWESCRKPLSDNGLAVIQSPSVDGVRVLVETLIVHSSGQWLRGAVSVSAKEDSPQAIGSCVTYLRRYALQSFVGVAPEDDDGEAAQGRSEYHQMVNALAQPSGYQAWLDDLAKVTSNGTIELERVWKMAKPEYRRQLIATDATKWEALKRRAAQATTEQLPA